MSYDPINTQQSFLAPNIDIPKPGENDEVFYQTINERERDTADVVNTKENGYYPLQETTNCQNWFTIGNPQTFRQAFREVILVSGLAMGANNFAHGLTIAGYTFTRIDGVIQNAGPTLAVPIPQGDDGTGTGVSVAVNGKNVVVTLQGVTYAGFSGQVVLEYLKN